MDYKKLSQIADSDLQLDAIVERAKGSNDPKEFVDRYLSKIKGIATRNYRQKYLYSALGIDYEDTSVVSLLDKASELFFNHYDWRSVDGSFEEMPEGDDLVRINKGFVDGCDAIIQMLTEKEAPEALVSWFKRVRSMARDKIMKISWGRRVIAPYKKLIKAHDHSWDDNDLSWVKVMPYEIRKGTEIIINPGSVKL